MKQGMFTTLSQHSRIPLLQKEKPTKRISFTRQTEMIHIIHNVRLFANYLTRRLTYGLPLDRMLKATFYYIFVPNS